MHSINVLLIVTAVLVVLFVPFYPFKMIKRFVFFFFNRFIPLPIKFEDIGGIPIVGMRLYGVHINLGPSGTLEAEEMHLRINLWRLLLLRRPSINPLTFIKPFIRVRQITEKGELWFLFPLTAVKWVLSALFMNLWGLNVVRMYRGTIVIEGKRGDTTIEDFNGEFTSHGSKVKVRRLSCMVGSGSLEIHYPRRGPMKEGRVIVRNMHIEHLVALKIPKNMFGPINIEAVMTGSVAETELVGHISSPALFMRDVPIQDFNSPLHFQGTELTLERMSGRIGEYLLHGSLVTDVETDITTLRLKGGGKGRASQDVLRMLAMKPFIESAGLEASVVLHGNLNELTEFEGAIDLKLRDAKIDFSQIGKGSMSDFPLAPIQEAELHLYLDRGNLKFIDCRASSGRLAITCTGNIMMNYDPETDRVTRSQFLFDFNVDCPDLQDLARLLALDRYRVTGSAEGKFRLDCDYGDTEGFYKLEGAGRLESRDVHLAGIPLAAGRTVKSPVDMWFGILNGDVALEKEQLRFENVVCSGNWMNLNVNGRLGFFDKELVVRGSVSPATHAIESNRILRLFPGAEGLAKKLKAGFKISGRTDKPHFRLSLFERVKELFGGAGDP
jgi:hypothetical protein